MNEKAVLLDCLASLDHAATRYQRAALECDTDPLRKLLTHLAVDKLEEHRAVFNLMHQAGIFRTETADPKDIRSVVAHAEDLLQAAGGPQHAVARERDSRGRPTAKV